MNVTIIKDRLPASIDVEPVDILFHATADTKLGKVLIARSATGVCAILIGESAGDLAADLAERKRILIQKEAMA
jgi:AraC family transcriptional regulator of adaptative response/methylated-DNA-[protein]-cysteine methyltransferase